MREIKFRGKRIDNGKWVYGDYFKTPLTDENSGADPKDGWFFLAGQKRHCIGSNGVAFVVDPKTVGQLINSDSSGSKELYEDDVVRCYGGERYHSYWEYDMRHKIGFDHDTFAMLNNVENIELFGNIHDNPELLK